MNRLFEVVWVEYKFDEEDNMSTVELNREPMNMKKVFEVMSKVLSEHEHCNIMGLCDITWRDPETEREFGIYVDE